MLFLQKHIAKTTEQTRLSDYAIGIFETIPTRKGIKKAIKKGAIYVNGTIGQTGTWIVEGDEIEEMGSDMQYQAIEVQNCIKAGKMQSDLMSWSDSLLLHEVMDSVRREAGVLYEWDS